MSVASRLTDAEEYLKGIGNAVRFQGRRVSAAAPSDLNFIGWNATTKKWEPKAGVLDVDLGQTDVVSSTDEETLYSYTIPADTLGATGGFRLAVAGDLLENAAGTLTIKVKLGATTIFSRGSMDHTNSAMQSLTRW